MVSPFHRGVKNRSFKRQGADRGSGRFGKAEALRGWIATRQGMDSSLKARGFFFARQMVVICDDLMVRGFIS